MGSRGLRCWLGSPKAGLPALAAIALACGCASGPAASTRKPPAAAAPAARSPAAEAPAPAWIRDLETELETLRALSFQRAVPFGTRTRAAFREQVRTDLARELPAPKAAGLSRAYATLGLLPAGFDLAQGMEDAFSTEVAAYYDPRLRTFTFVEPSSGGARSAKETGTVAIHELAHALQDQHFDLQRFEGEVPPADLDDDQKLARHCVVEGEATFLMMAHELGSGPPQSRRLGPLAVAGLRMNVTMLAAADMLQLLAAIRLGSRPEELDADARAELSAIQKLPVMVTMPMFEPYFKGALFVSDVWAAGGWPAVDAIYRSPPDSTEQILHPVEKYLGRRDPPVIIRLPPAATKNPVPGAVLAVEETIGELGWRVYFRTWNTARGDRAAAGWGGDRLWSWSVGDRTIAAVATTWDTEAEAREFADTYEETLAARFPLRVAGGQGGELRLPLAGGELLSVALRGRDVDLVIGANERELVVLAPLLRDARRDTRRSAP